MSNGSYKLVSSHAFFIDVDDGRPTRPDFPGEQAYCHQWGNAFVLKDPGTGKWSTYVVASANVIVEFSNNGGGKIHLWKKE